MQIDPLSFFVQPAFFLARETLEIPSLQRYRLYQRRRLPQSPGSLVIAHHRENRLIDRGIVGSGISIQYEEVGEPSVPPSSFRGKRMA